MKLHQVRKHALALPDTSEAPHFNFSSFRVHGKIFVTIPPDEEHIHVFAPEAEREAALALHGDFLEKLYWGAKVLGLRVWLSDADSAVVKRLVTCAWEAKAPKRLLAAWQTGTQKQADA